MNSYVENDKQDLTKFANSDEYTDMKKLYDLLAESEHTKVAYRNDMDQVMETLRNLIKNNAMNHKLLNYCENLIMVVLNYEIAKQTYTAKKTGRNEYKLLDAISKNEKEYQTIVDYGTSLVVRILNDKYKAETGKDYTYQSGDTIKSIPSYPNGSNKENYNSTMKDIVEAGNRLFNEIDNRKLKQEATEIEKVNSSEITEAIKKAMNTSERNTLDTTLWYKTPENKDDLNAMFEEDFEITTIHDNGNDEVRLRMEEIQKEIKKLQAEYNELAKKVNKTRPY